MIISVVLNDFTQVYKEGIRGVPHTSWQVKCGPADRRTGKLWTKLADRVRILPTCVASCHRPRRPTQGRISYLIGPSLPPSTSLSPPLLTHFFPLSLLFPSLTIQVSALNIATRVRERCNRGLGQIPSVNRIWCI